MGLQFGQTIIDIIRGKKIKQWIKQINFKESIEKYRIKYDKSLDIEIPDGLSLHLGINGNCNCQCKFCFGGHHNDGIELPDELLYNYLVPLYPKVSKIMTCGSEITISKRGFDYIKWLNENYTYINIESVSNGIAFDEKWQQLAMDTLMTCYFSINAIDAKTWKQNVWETDNAENLWNRIENNVTSYIDKLKQNNLSCFAPSITMVLNKNSYSQIQDFIILGLKWNVRTIAFLFDIHENSVMKEKIENPQEYEKAIKQLLELERICKGYFNISFRLFIALPYKKLCELEQEVEKMDINELRNKYSGVWNLVRSRNVKKEFEERDRIRKEHGKSPIPYYTDVIDGLRYRKLNKDKYICANPWKHLEIDMHGRFKTCCHTTLFGHYTECVKNNAIDWKKDVFNGSYYKTLRKNFSKFCYDGCMRNCPASEPNGDNMNFIMPENEMSITQ